MRVKAKQATEIERIRDGDTLLAVIVRASHAPKATEFVTSPDMTFQLGFICYPAGGEIAPHVHKPLARHIRGTNEVLLVRSGRLDVTLYGEDRTAVVTRELRPGDVILLLAGGHGFRMHEDTVLLEVKQGPYTGLDEKERFAS